MLQAPLGLHRARPALAPSLKKILRTHTQHLASIRESIKFHGQRIQVLEILPQGIILPLSRPFHKRQRHLTQQERPTARVWWVGLLVLLVWAVQLERQTHRRRRR